jgi:hypothetical protein
MMYIHYMSRLVRKQLYITADQDQRLKETAAREKRSEADVIRSALDERLKPKRKPSRRTTRDPLWSIVGVGTAQSGDTSTRVDEFLYGRDRK